MKFQENSYQTRFQKKWIEAWANTREVTKGEWENNKVGLKLHLEEQQFRRKDGEKSLCGRVLKKLVLPRTFVFSCDVAHSVPPFFSCPLSIPM